MRLRHLLLAAATATGLATAAPAAQAALVNGIFEVTLRGLTVGSTPDPAVVRFSITFDDSASVPGTTANIALLSSDLLLDSALAFSYDDPADRLTVGGQVAGLAGLQADGADFAIFISSPATAPALTGAFYTPDGRVGGSVDRTTDGTITFTAATPVPEPASLALLGMGLVALAGVRRRRMA